MRSGRVPSSGIAYADTLVVSPGLSIREGAIRLAADSGKNVLGDIELFEVNASIIPGMGGESVLLGTELLLAMSPDGEFLYAGHDGILQTSPATSG